MANELLRNADGDPVPQRLKQGASVTPSSGDTTKYELYDNTTIDTAAYQRDKDSISSADQTDVVTTGTWGGNVSTHTPKYAEVDENTSGDRTIVSAVTSTKIRVMSYTLVVAGDVNLEWRSATTGITGAFPFASNGGISVGYCKLGHFETNAGEALNLNLSSAVQVSGHVVYIEV